MPGFFERMGRIMAPLPEDLPPPTPPSQTLTGRIAQMVAPDEQAAEVADTIAAGVEETKSTSAPMDVEPAVKETAAPAVAPTVAPVVKPIVAKAPGKHPLKVGIRISGANWEEYNSKHNVEQLIAEITGEMVRAQADSPVKFMHEYLTKNYPEVKA